MRTELQEERNRRLAKIFFSGEDWPSRQSQKLMSAYEAMRPSDLETSKKRAQAAKALTRIISDSAFNSPQTFLVRRLRLNGRDLIPSAPSSVKHQDLIRVHVSGRTISCMVMSPVPGLVSEQNWAVLVI